LNTFIEERRKKLGTKTKRATQQALVMMVGVD